MLCHAFMPSCACHKPAAKSSSTQLIPKIPTCKLIEFYLNLPIINSTLCGEKQGPPIVSFFPLPTPPPPPPLLPPWGKHTKFSCDRWEEFFALHGGIWRIFPRQKFSKRTKSKMRPDLPLLHFLPP